MRTQQVNHTEIAKALEDYRKNLLILFAIVVSILGLVYLILRKPQELTVWELSLAQYKNTPLHPPQKDVKWTATAACTWESTNAAWSTLNDPTPTCYSPNLH